MSASLGGLGALVLAGGRASRLGGIDKTALELGGGSLLARAVVAAREAGAEPVVAVGPARAEVDAVWAREDPPFGGPVAAIDSGLAQLRTEWVLVLAADLREPAAAATALMHAEREADGCLLADPDGHPQWLCGVYRTAALRTALSALPAVAGTSMGALLSGLRLARHPVAASVVADVDTPADARAAGISLG